MTDGDQAAVRPTVRRLVGVYNANGTVRGELAYFVGARLDRTHCALCDITHGRVHERPEWQSCRAGLPVPFDTFHRNDQPASVRKLLGNDLPAVMAETDDGPRLLLGPDDLAACGASPERLADALTEAVERQGLSWTWEVRQRIDEAGA